MITRSKFPASLETKLVYSYVNATWGRDTPRGYLNVVIALHEVDLDLASRWRDKYPLVDSQLFRVLSLVVLL